MDIIADMLTRIRNAQAVYHETVRIPYSRLRHDIATVLKREGYIEDVHRRGRHPARRFLEIVLKYHNGAGVVHHLRRVSKPGRRVYRKAAELRPVLNGHGHLVLSTSRGVMIDHEARQQRVGGEVLFEVW